MLETDSTYSPPRLMRLVVLVLSAILLLALLVMLPPPLTPNAILVVIVLIAINLWFSNWQHANWLSQRATLLSGRNTNLPSYHNALRAADYVLSSHKLTVALANVLSVKQVAYHSNKISVEATGAVTGMVVLITEGQKSLEVIDIVGADHAGANLHVTVGQILPLDAPLSIAKVIRTRQVIWVNKELPSPSVVRPLEPNATLQSEIDADHGSLKAWATIPLMVNDQVIGCMELGFADHQEFNEQDRIFIVLLALKCALAIERARLHNEVHDQRERLQVTLSSIGDAVITTDDGGTITFMNNVAEQLTGWKLSETGGFHLRDIFQIIDEATRELQEDPITKVLHANTVVGLATHTILIAKNGSEIPIDDSGAPIRDLTGKIVGIILVFRDISERRKRETALDDTLQRTQDLYETCRRIGLVSNPTDVIQALLSSRYLGHASQCALFTFDTPWISERPDHFEVAAMSNQDKLFPGFAHNHTFADSPLSSVLSRTEPIYIENIQLDPRLESRARDQLQQASTPSVMIFPLKIGNRCFGLLPIYFANPQQWNQDDYQHIQVFIDQVCVTMENARLFDAEARARLDAEHSDQIKLKFLAMISHELRTPLTSIKGFATTLLATDLVWDPESQHKFIVIINDEADKLTDLIGQLLDLSRLQAGKLHIQPEIRMIREIVDSAMAQLGIITANHHLVIDIPPALPSVMVDMHRIAEVLVNLVGNAAKYSPRGTQISVSAQANDHMVQINVADEGSGILVENRTLVFEAFLQLENASHHQGKGLGLGLAICKGLIEAHKGNIWIADTPVGTTVSFTLPIWEQHP